jgi:hypothetical protein
MVIAVVRCQFDRELASKLRLYIQIVCDCDLLSNSLLDWNSIEMLNLWAEFPRMRTRIFGDWRNIYEGCLLLKTTMFLIEKKKTCTQVAGGLL